MKMTQDELNVILAEHKKWLNNDGGKRANLQYANLRSADLRSANLRSADLLGADLRSADLRSADLRSADLQGADLRSADLQEANLQGADLQGADLQGADLRGADLRYANLLGADLDYSCFPLWCGGTRFKANDRLVQQVLAHLCSLEVSKEARIELDKVLDFAKKSHRAKDCGIL